MKLRHKIYPASTGMDIQLRDNARLGVPMLTLLCDDDCEVVPISSIRLVPAATKSLCVKPAKHHPGEAVGVVTLLQLIVTAEDNQAPRHSLSTTYAHRVMYSCTQHH